MAGTAAWIDVLPNLSTFGTKLNSGVTAAATSAGRNAGKKFSDAMNQAAGRDVLYEQVKSLRQSEKKAAQTVQKCTTQIAKSRDEQKTADLRLQAAEISLQETMAKSGPLSSKTIAAQARLNDARSKARQKTDAVKSAEGQLKAAHIGLRETQNQLKDAQERLNLSTSKQSGFFASAAASARNAIGSFRSMRGSVSSASASGVNDSTRFFTAWGSAKFGAIAGFAQSAFSKVTSIVTSNVSGAISRADTMNNFPKVMKNLGYNSDEAAAAIKRISASIDGLPTTTSSMIGMVQQLAPLTSNLDEATSIALAFNNAVLAGGKDTVMQANAIEQYNQMLSANKVDAAAWRSVVNAMPGQVNQLAKSILGANAKQNDLYEAMKGGEVTFNDFNKALVKLNRDGYGQYASFTQQAKDATQGIGTAMENARNRVQKSIEKIIEAFGVDRISDVINRFTAKFGDVGSAAAKAVSGALEFVSSGKVNDKLAESFHLDKNATASIEDAYRRIRLGYAGLTTFIKEGRFTTEFNTAFEGVDGDIMVDFRQSLLDVRDAASELLKNLPGLGAFFDTPKDGDKSNLAKTLKVVNVTLHGIKPLLDLLTTMEKAWNNLSAEQQGTIFDTAIYLWLGSKGFKILKNVWGIGKGIAKTFKTAGAAIKSVGTFLGGLKEPKWLTSLMKAGGKLFRTGGKLSFAAPAATMAGTAVVTGQTAEHGTPKWVWTILQKLQGKDTSDKAYARYRKEYKANSERKILGVSGNQVAHALNPVNWPGMIASGAGKAWDGLKTAAMTSGQAQADTASMQVQAQQAGLEQVKKAWRDATGWINDNWCDLMVKIQGRFDAAVDWVESGWQGVCGWFSGIGASIGGFFAGVPAAIGGFFDSAGQWAQTKWQGVCGWFSGIPGIITGFFTGIPDTFGSLFQTAKDRITGIFGSVGGWFDTNVRTPIHDAIHAIGQTFESTKDWVRRSWDQVRDAAKSPVKFIVDTVYDKGIKKVWNSVAGAVGLKLALPDVKFANGGTVGGINPGYAPGVDSIPAMTSPGEAWMVPEWTRAVGAENIYRWNALARHRGVQAVRDDMGIGHYAKGGIATPAQAIAKANSIHSGYAGMCLKFVQDCYNAAARFPSALAAWQGSTSRHALGKSVSGVPQGAPLYMADGNPAGHVAIYLGGGRMRTTNSADGRIHTDPVSLWTGKYGYRLQGWTGDIEGQSIPGLGKGVISTALDAMDDMLSDIGDWVRSRIVDPVKRMVSGVGGGQWGGMVGQLPVMAAESLASKAASMAAKLIGANNDSGSTVSGGVERWRGLVQRVLKELGQSDAWTDTVLRRMNQESGGNPNAVNNWDSNARAGQASRGLMQTIPGTFNAYAGKYRNRGITDPLANIYAGLNYALHRYGSLSALNRAGGYALGGIVGDDRPTLYDRGGILPPGRHLVANETKQPELVLTREQVLKVFGGEVRDKGDRTVNLNVNIPERSDPWADASILVRTARHQLR